MIAIVGAGQAGLLAANMLRGCLVVERNSELPHNHSAVLRFKSTVVSDVLGIPFKKVTMIKDNLPWRNPVADALAYSFKNTGKYRSDRSITAGLTVAERYIAPPDFIERMAAAIPALQLGWDEDFQGDGPYISTIPMTSLMTKLGYKPQSRMEWAPAINVKATVLDCEAYVTLMVPDPKIPFSRVSVTGNELIVEMCNQVHVPWDPELIAAQGARLLGLESALTDVRTHESGFAKILPMDEDERREFIYNASVQRNIFSLGRFATWRPGVQMDDLVKDIRKIQGFIRSGKPSYDMKMER